MTQEKFSGFRVAVGCFLVMFACQAALQSFSIFMPSIIETTQVPTAGISMMSTTAGTVAFIFNMFVGKIIKKLGVKKALVIGVICCAGHFIIYGTSNGLVMLYLGAAIGGISICLATVAPLSIIVNNWFIKMNGTIWTIVMAGSMIAGVIMYPIAGSLIEAIGWRQTYVILGCVVAVIALFGAIVLITDSPERLGQKPYGYGENMEKSTTEVALEGTDVAVIKKSASFYLILIGLLLVGLSTNTENFLPSFWQSNGMGVAESSRYLSVYAGICAIASILLGRVADKKGGRAFQAITSVCFLFSLIAFAITQTVVPVTVIVLAAIFAFGAKKTSGAMPPIVMQYAFGKKDYAKVAGYSAGMIQLGIALSNPIIGAVKDATGSYRIPFLAMAVVGVVAFILLQIGMGTAPYKGGKQKA